jgi:hypothetical protein
MAQRTHKRVLENGPTDAQEGSGEWPHLEAVVHVLDAALGEAQLTQVDLVKDHSLQELCILSKY